ncbi:hypothetical protein [Heliophilum fasciatum]|uniref:Uncharacterized protein n=1 Tax=Heliophilum fasciatum TaxID=35700 RepID=A0A4R2RG50_9FIRM|nr:hypothetical protein [Heliophilum fasciatum]MCW2279065.1 hypothetical protein [Heliophilum fasciatum]TCP61528.1 hypothetical protein EDD73_12732 [Heliophilum fasciatum]
MKGKPLPIKIFEKRDVDERAVEAGGDKKPPKWVLKGKELKERAMTLKKDLDDSQPIIESRMKKHKIPAIVKACVIDDALAKTHRNDIAQLLSGRGPDYTIGIIGENELLIRIDKPGQLKEVSDNISDLEKNAKAISGVKKIDVFNPNISIGKIVANNEGKFVLKVILVDFNDKRINETNLQYFKRWITNRQGISLDKSVRYSSKLEVHQVVVDSLDKIEDLTDFSGILSVEEMPRMEGIEDDFFPGTWIEVPNPEENVEYPIIESV